MGMDVIGLKPKNRNGRCFLNNIWWWHTLWDFACTEANLDDQIRRAGHFNDGCRLDEKAAASMAIALRNALNAGRVALRAQAHVAAKSEAPQENCPFCGGTGLVAQLSGDALADGEFSKENVTRFIEFLENCGGMEVW